MQQPDSHPDSEPLRPVEPHLRFGTSGVPRHMEGASHVEGIKEVARFGLSAMELAFVHQVNVNEKTAAVIRATAAECDVALSVHAPYYINLNSDDPRKVAASKQRIVRAAYIGALCGATHVVFHAGWRHDSEPQLLRDTITEHLRDVSRRVTELGADIWLCPETMGKAVQYGDLDEVIRLGQDISQIRPCVDFAHLHAHSGLANTEDEFEAVLDRIAAGLGQAAVSGLHMHVSGIQYGKHGEIRHLLLDDSDLNYQGLLRVLHRRGVAGRVICESPHNAEDAALLQGTWRHICGC
ncbi:MAG: TIM barrel protein [Anaerolineae bacterium]